VRSKADLLFSQFFRQATGKKYERKDTIGFHERCALTKTEQNSLVTFDDTRLFNKVYLTAAACDDDDVKGAPFAAFDLDKLKKNLVELAMTDIRGERICKLAIRASITVINTCFRRGYAVSQTKYRWLAAGASLVPFLDQLPAFFGREKIRQVFGIHDSFAVTNAFHRTRDSFEEYLIEKTFTVPKEYLKSGYFKYLIPKATKQTTTTSQTKLDKFAQQKKKAYHVRKNLILQDTSIDARQTAQNMAGDSTFTGVLFSVLSSVPISHSTGKRMDEHLHLLCDDLVVILQYFAFKLCNDCCRCIQLPRLPSSDEDSSSSDND
jgi:hypothetical protein